MEEMKAEEKKEDESGTSLFHQLMAQRKDLEEDVKIVLQRLIVIARLPHHLADRTQLGAHYEKLNFRLSKQYIWDHITGLLLIYPSCLLHIVESSREVLVSVLKDLKDMQQQPDCTLLEAPKVVFMAHNPQNRLFQQWSYKVLDADQGDIGAKRLEEEEESTETLVCTVLSALQKMSEHLVISKKALPGSVLDETPELIVSQEVLDKLLAREELQTPQQHLQMYNSPLNISMDFGQVIRSSFLTTV
ncbi:testis-expressed protein 47 isoform X2 [Siniperca chuatsi]|uniref:testis-expressed protein 47 isoform X2 n=1 Tax=Siniperca chuatsi TaxID=119488 RepID=UPI001CE07BD4|nr:testis-expressed protein 47 isoform X2 [Siniperca chuatsi]